LHGLQTSYFATPTLSGRPVDFSLGLMGGTGATGTGLTSRAWAAGSPGSGIPAENFSLRLTGVITFPTAGDYKLSSLFDDGGRVWLDDILVIDDGVPDGAVTPVTSLPFTVTAGERKRIRIDFFEL